MQNPTKPNRTLAVLTNAMLMTCLLLATGNPTRISAGARQGNPNPGILPIGSTPHGKTYSEWSRAWLLWAYSIPADINPVADTTGVYAAVGQSGNVWFLAGTFGGSADRTVTVPHGKALFFPILNYIWVNLPQYGDNPWSPAQEAFARGLIAGLLDNSTITCQIDGREVADLQSYRSQTRDGEEYMVTFPDNSEFFLAPGTPLPAGTYGPSVDGGYYLMLVPPSAGQHTIHFSAAAADGSFSLDVTYHLTVK